jgi:PQQ-dependent catabolism-associated CXXCW motif protein
MKTGSRPGAVATIAVTAMVLCSSGALGANGANEDCVPDEPDGYRMKAFRAPVPCTLAGAQVVSTAQLRALLLDGPVLLVDVLPSPRRPAGLPEDALWQPVLRRNIPGSVWLPNTGFGELPREEEAYLRDNLERLTEGDRSRRVVIYCLADCWMSWNAARRAVSWGYTAVIWYPQGTDGWRASGLPLAESIAVPRGVGH